MTKKALLTGSTGGIGTEISLLLAQDGWDLILLNRNGKLGQQQADSLKTQFPEQSFASYQANLMDLEEIKKTTDDIKSSYSAINAVFNVAGLLTDKRIMNKQGIEGHFALNTVAPYAIAEAMRTTLSTVTTENSPAFIINFSSSAINGVKKLDAFDLVNPDEIGGLMGAYARSKAALNVLACAMKDDLMKDSIYIYSVDPGPTRTKMTDGNEGMPWFLRKLAPLLFSDADKQAKKLLNGIYDAIAKRQSGLYISNGKIKKNPALAEDTQTQNELYKLLKQLTK